MKPERSDAGWVYSILPVNIAVGPVGTFVQLSMLELHGTVIDIGLATTLFNAVSIPAAMLWGFTTDRYHRRKVIIAGSYFALAANLILFILAHTIQGIVILYAAFSLISSAAATPLNLLIMETQPKPKWALTFARFSMASSIGVTFGLLLGVSWADYFPLQLMVAPMASLSLLSAILALAMIKEPAFVFEREMIVMVRRSFHERLFAVPLLFLKIPGLFDFRKTFEGVRYELTRDTQVLYLSIFAFNVAGGLFNTSLVPSLFAASVSKAQIFLVSLVAMIVQVFSFRYAGPYIEKRNLKATAVVGLVLRSAGYVMTGLVALLMAGLFYLGAVLVLYSLAAGVAYALYYSASNVMVFNTLGKSGQGSKLGVFSALVGIATTVGAFISGYLSFFLGFYTTFIVAGICLASAAWLTSLVTTIDVKDETSTAIVP